MMYRGFKIEWDGTTYAVSESDGWVWDSTFASVELAKLEIDAAVDGPFGMGR